MEVHRQRCQSCQSIDLRNIIVRKVGHPTQVYVRCVSCRQLVARYLLRGYYHHGKGVESYLRSVGSGDRESGRDVLAEFQRVQHEAESGYEEALKCLEEQEKNI